MAKIGGVYDESMEKYIATNKVRFFVFVYIYAVSFTALYDMMVWFDTCIYHYIIPFFLYYLQALYDRSGKERKQILPGEKDKYRETRFQRDDENQTYRIIYSEMEKEKSTVF